MDLMQKPYVFKKSRNTNQPIQFVNKVSHNCLKDILPKVSVIAQQAFEPGYFLGHSPEH